MPRVISSLPALLCILSLLSGCAVRSWFPDRQEAADRVAREKGFRRMVIPGTFFPLTAFIRIACPGAPLTIYMEGDGSAWLSRTWRADDPTPATPLVLSLAGMDSAMNVAYLARPGQYDATGTPRCDPAYWSERRFAPEVAAAASEAVGVLRNEAKASKIHLVGYSGGAALAVLVSSRRNDIASLRTIAGNLDPDALNRRHGVSPLHGSLNPQEAGVVLRRLPQRHFVGEEDTMVPLFIAQSFAKRMGDKDGRSITVVSGASHAGGWRERWPGLLAMPLWQAGETVDGYR